MFVKGDRRLAPPVFVATRVLRVVVEHLNPAECIVTVNQSIAHDTPPGASFFTRALERAGACLIVRTTTTTQAAARCKCRH